MSDTWTLRTLRWSYVAFITYSSAETFLEAWRAPHTNHGLHGALGLLALSGAEMLAAIAFLAEVLDAIALTMLLLIFVIASALTIGEGEVPLRFLYFAATAAYITIAHRRMVSRTNGTLSAT